MNMIEAVKTVFSKYVVFKGRARRAEYWWFVLFYMIANIILQQIDIMLFGTTETVSGDGSYSYSGSTDFPLFSGVFGLATLLPMLGVAVRRLHDINKSGWWLLIGFIPLIGAIILIVWMATGGDKGANRFGNDPIDGSGDDPSGGEPEYTATSIPSVSND